MLKLNSTLWPTSTNMLQSTALTALFGPLLQVSSFTTTSTISSRKMIPRNPSLWTSSPALLKLAKATERAQRLAWDWLIRSTCLSSTTPRATQLISEERAAVALASQKLSRLLWSESGTRRQWWATAPYRTKVIATNSSRSWLYSSLTQDTEISVCVFALKFKPFFINIIKVTHSLERYTF